MTPPELLPWLARWDLLPDGAGLVTPTSRLLPVRRDGVPLMLKLATVPEERRGNAVMAWWDGDGAAPVFACEAGALLMERAEGRRSLAAMARTGEDATATAILCDAVAALHRPRAGPLPELVPLDAWFEGLWPVAAAEGGLLARAAETARRLLATPAPVVVLHGDMHHGNLLDFGVGGWLAIDPKGLIGPRGFDYGNIFANPDLDAPEPPVAVRPEIFARRLAVVTERSGLDRAALLDWIVAVCGLSAAWFIADRMPAEIDLAVAAMAAAARDA
jgi:streptomycin 6-kinase